MRRKKQRLDNGWKNAGVRFVLAIVKPIASYFGFTIINW
jgi:hypothetical protein